MKIAKVIELLEIGSCQYCPYLSDNPRTCFHDCDYKDAVLQAIENFKTIDQIVKAWKVDTWTDNKSYDCMCKISEVLNNDNEPKT